MVIHDQDFQDSNSIPEFPQQLKFEVELRAWHSDENVRYENVPVYEWINGPDEAPVIIDILEVPTERRTGPLHSGERSLSRVIARTLAKPIQDDAIVEALIFKQQIDREGLALCDMTDKQIGKMAYHSWQREIDELYNTNQQALAEFLPDAGLRARRMRKQRNRTLETLALHCRVVGGNAPIRTRCSLNMSERKRDMMQRQADFVENHKIVGAGGEVIKLADGGVTAEKRLSEMYTMVKGLQSAAEAQGLTWSRVVVTVPGPMHPNPKRSGAKNWDGTLPSEAAAWLQKRWQLFRARLAKKSIKIAGLWTLEAHADGCPHLNFLFYYNSKHATVIQDAFIDLFAHSAQAVDWENGDTAKKGAQFASYALKYFTKFFNENPDADAIDESAWASCWTLRRHGFYGIPPLSAWRRLRAQHQPPQTRDPLLLSAWRSARGGKAHVWIMLNGGLACKATARPVRALYVQRKRSQVCVGVENQRTRQAIVNKTPGYWNLVKVVDTEDKENHKVTLVLNYPSGGASAPPLDPFDLGFATTPPPIPITAPPKPAENSAILGYKPYH
ncbi:bacteriophage replication protein A [mine drainage metagenome]|uniref:Bacteriophage replication protein A n=1 Tax=mine drainage metagenome TaxID=410659 RepID=A0A1J5QH64_9ZZZZ